MAKAFSTWGDRASEFVGVCSTRNESTSDSAARLKRMIQGNWLLFDDLEKRPDKFFLAHREIGRRHAGGFGIRFTVQFNLFAGSILGLGGPEHVAKLKDYQEDGVLGCFALTEVSAGVNSGLIVDTTAEWDATKQHFVLNTPNKGAAKNWISQGLHASMCVVFANLIVDGEKQGPHPFLIQLRDSNSKLADGVVVEDMGEKTIANDLDNARLTFQSMVIQKDTLLSRFCDIQDNKYVVKGQRLKIQVIGQRLLTGRLCIAQAAVANTQDLLQSTEDYCKKKVVHVYGGKSTLAQLPHMADLFRESKARLVRMEQFCAGVEAKLSVFLRNNEVATDNLVEAIAVAKIRSIEVAMDVWYKVGKEVGSYGLMAESKFQATDMLKCCKFAEGDTRILMQKITRDNLIAFNKSSFSSKLYTLTSGFLSSTYRPETIKMTQLAYAMFGLSKKQMPAAWNDNWNTIFEVADKICDRHIEEEVGKGTKHCFQEMTMR